MDVELFPFEQVPQRSKIVLYGFGTVGRNYYMQLRRTQYCDIVAVVDKDAKNYGKIIVPVITPSKFYAFPCNIYDYVVIAISNAEIIESIINDFLFHGIPENKIISDTVSRAIWDGDWRTLAAQGIQGVDLQESPKGIIRYLNSLAILGRQEWKEYYVLSDAIKLQIKEKETLLVSFKKNVVPYLPPKTRLLFLRLLYDQRCFDADCMKNFMNTLQEMPWDDDTAYFCILNSDLPMAFHCAESLYDEFYQDRKELMQRLVTHYRLQLPEKQTAREGKRATFVCYAFEFANVVYTLVRQYIDGFLAQGYTIQLVILGAFGEPDYNNVAFPPLWTTHKPEEFEWRIREWFPVGVDIVYIEEQDIGKRMQMAVDAICEYNPVFIVDMSDECFPEGWLLIKRFPIIEFPLRGFVTSAAFDAYISSNPGEALRRKTIAPEKLVHLVLGNIPQKKNQPVYTRRQWGFDDNDFLMITVGSRLQWEADSEFIAHVCQMMKRECRMKWVLVEVGSQVDSDFPLFQRYLQEGRIIHWGFEYHLDSFYKIMDVFLNPNREGGGVSIRQAMVAGLPVAMTDFPSGNLSRMRGHVVHGGYAKLTEYVLRLCREPAFCRSEGEAMRSLMEELTPQSDAEKLLAICEEVSCRVKSKKDG